jgi:hypothetical protein
MWMLNWKPPGKASETPRAPVKGEEVYLPSQSMISEGVSLVLDGGDLSFLDPRLLRFLIPPLREMKQRALEAGNYAAAQRADQGQRNVHNQEAFQATVDLQDGQTQKHSERAEVAEIQLENIREKWELLLTQKKEQMRQSIATMQEEFAVALERFDRQFEEPPPPARIKLSPQCLDLRFKEKHLSRSKRFAEASAMKRLADAMEETEMKQRRDEWIRDLSVERQKMIEKEKRNEFVREMAWQTAITKLEMTAADEIARAERNAQFLRMKKEKSTNEAELTKTSRKLPPLLLVKQFGATLPKTVR